MDIPYLVERKKYSKCSKQVHVHSINKVMIKESTKKDKNTII